MARVQPQARVLGRAAEDWPSFLPSPPSLQALLVATWDRIAFAGALGPQVRKGVVGKGKAEGLGAKHRRRSWVLDSGRLWRREMEMEQEGKATQGGGEAGKRKGMEAGDSGGRPLGSEG